MRKTNNNNMNMNISPEERLPFPNETTVLHCEHCPKRDDAIWMHFGNPIVHYAGDDYHPNNPLGLRGNWIEIPCQCEWCHNFTSIIVGFHKGIMYVQSIKTKKVSSSTDHDYIMDEQFVNITRVSKITKSIK